MAYTLPNGITTDWIAHEDGWLAAVNRNWKVIDWATTRWIKQQIPNVGALPASPANGDAYMIAGIDVYRWNQNTTSYDIFPLDGAFLFYDQFLADFFKWEFGLINPLIASGDVVGPSSATDNAIVLFDGVTGKLIKESPVFIDPVTANVTGINDLIMSGSLTVAVDSNIGGNQIIGGNQQVIGQLTAGSTDAATANTFRDTTVKNVGSGLGNVAISNSSGNASVTSSSYTQVSNMTVTLTTRGNPVKIYCIPDVQVNNASSISIRDTNIGFAQGFGRIRRDGIDIAGFELTTQSAVASSTDDPILAVPPGIINTVDVGVAAGSHTYTIQVQVQGGNNSTFRFTNVMLVAEEMI